MMTTDDESATIHDESALKSLNTIELVIQAGTFVYERLKKASGHRIQFGETVVKPPASLRKFKSNEEKPFKFVFQYRPKDMLQALGIMPRDPTPPTVVKPDDGETETDGDNESEEDPKVEAQIQDLQKQLDELRQRCKRKSGVKREGRDGRHKRIKVERIEVPRSLVPGEVIDLTM
ncbi:hypothetical protein DACRYDRAFT_114111 [Dacryopinax primogenitus]|uniref:Uncharacterized protein n=1 Tax=Dacryopinax primogenitus (strain DJM 731) TaxID=1858805 RepID=M5GDS6_DACPD|nr:uncharacterized protein DACRYDRAFT_114111 [Dacryopinax primogenitus]EJU04787.1 hypothetical protein DACRYDRAFT_114111 [Dacryopinax primogenitus]